MTLQHKPGTNWDEVYRRARQAAPEAFETNRIANLIGEEWRIKGQVNYSRNGCASP
jgi:hypothetical protein